MTIEDQLRERAGAKCELCSSDGDLSVYEVHPHAETNADTCALVCETCRAHLAAPAAAEPSYWYCLRESMWSEFPAVKVLVYRVLKQLGDGPLAQELLGQMYLDAETQAWADAHEGGGDEGDEAVVRDSNGTVLQTGDTVTLIKDLDVKGAGFTAKRGTTVKGIALTDDPKYVEGRVNGIRIVLVAAYLKKA